MQRTYTTLTKVNTNLTTPLTDFDLILALCVLYCNRVKINYYYYYQDNSQSTYSLGPVCEFVCISFRTDNLDTCFKVS